MAGLIAAAVYLPYVAIDSLAYSAAMVFVRPSSVAILHWICLSGTRSHIAAFVDAQHRHFVHRLYWLLLVTLRIASIFVSAAAPKVSRKVVTSDPHPHPIPPHPTPRVSNAGMMIVAAASRPRSNGSGGGGLRKLTSPFFFAVNSVRVRPLTSLKRSPNILAECACLAARSSLL